MRTWRSRSAAAVVSVGLALLAAACGGASPSSTGSNAGSTGTGSTTSSELAFARCMRSNGVANFPDPSGGTFPKATLGQLAAGNPHFHTATRACAHLLPIGDRGPSAMQLEEVRAEGIRFARCMRRHGVDLPDPASTGRIPDPSSIGIDQGSPQFEAGNQACSRYRPPYMPSNAAYNAYARTRGS